MLNSFGLIHSVVIVEFQYPPSFRESIYVKGKGGNSLILFNFLLKSDLLKKASMGANHFLLK